jgi:hypothetical protein
MSDKPELGSEALPLVVTNSLHLGVGSSVWIWARPYSAVELFDGDYTLKDNVKVPYDDTTIESTSRTAAVALTTILDSVGPMKITTRDGCVLRCMEPLGEAFRDGWRSLAPELKLMVLEFCGTFCEHGDES